MRSTPLARSLRRGRSLLLPVLLVLPAACASAEKRVEQGMRLEQEGRSAEAARRYIDALRKDPSLGDARQRLQATGAQAVSAALREASLLESAGRLDEAADALAVAEEVSGGAREVGVAVPLPADFAGRRRALYDRAIERSVAAALEASRGGRHDAADQQLLRALQRYQPAPAQRTELVQARVEVNVAAAEADIARGDFRLAYQRAERLREGLGQGMEAEWLAPLALVQEDALRRGTRRVAVLPVAVGREQRVRLPDEFALELSDVLEARHWTRPPLFVEVLDASRTRGAWRRLGPGRRVISTRQAADVGRDLGADLVMVAEVDSVARFTGPEVQRTRRPARTRDGVDTAYTVVEGREEIRVRVRWALVDPELARVVDEGDANAATGARFRRAEYTGDPGSLDLPRSERDLFDAAGGAGAIDRELSRELVRELAPDLAREVFSRLERHIR